MPVLEASVLGAELLEEGLSSLHLMFSACCAWGFLLLLVDELTSELFPLSIVFQSGKASSITLPSITIFAGKIMVTLLRGLPSRICLNLGQRVFRACVISFGKSLLMLRDEIRSLFARESINTVFW